MAAVDRITVRPKGDRGAGDDDQSCYLAFVGLIIGWRWS